MGERSKSLLVYTTMHFIVDFTCFYILIGILGEVPIMVKEKGMLFLLYNFVAFAFQVVIGAFMKKESYRRSVLTGIVFILVGLIVTNISISNVFAILVIILIGLGNAFFHIGGGIDALIYSQGRYARPGIFVSSGAIGVSLGTYMGARHIVPVWMFITLLLGGIVVVCLLKENEEEKVEPAHVITYVFQKEEDNRTVYSIVLLFCMLAIGIRSYVGSMITVKTDWFLWPAIFACMGKAFGGVLADRFGVRKIALGSLAISGICLWIPGDIVVIRLMGVFLFNFVMPITLYILYEQFAHQPGFAFGLSTLALFLGILPGYFLNIAEEFYHNIILALTMAAVLLLFVCLPAKSEKGNTYETSV